MSLATEQFVDAPCLNCGGTYRPAQQATDAERALLAHPTEPVPLPPHYDTAPLDVIRELGPLYVCDGCGSGMRGMRARPAPTPTTDAPPAPAD